MGLRKRIEAYRDLIADAVPSAGTIIALMLAFAIGSAGISTWWMLVPMVIAAMANRARFERGQNWGHEMTLGAFYLAAKRGDGKVVIYLPQPPAAPHTPEVDIVG